MQVNIKTGVFALLILSLISGFTTLNAQVMVPKDKKVWFITGSSRGFGFDFAKSALERGDYVITSSIEPKRIESLKKQFGDRILSEYVDVTNRNQVFASVQKAKTHFGRIDILISNAGYGHFGAVEEFSDEELRQQMEVNFFGSFNVIQAVLPIMREQRTGHIIQISSNGGIAAFPLVGAYNASKWAIEGLCDALADEVKQFGIHVTIVEPGSFKTNFMNAAQFVSKPVDDYKPMTNYFKESIDPETFGDLKEVTQKVMNIIDAPEPPLRVLVGKGVLELFEEEYAERLRIWKEWEK